MTTGQKISVFIFFLILISVPMFFIFHNEHRGHNCKFIIYDSHNVKHCTNDYESAGPNCIQFYDQQHNGETVICGSFTITHRK